MRTDVGFVCCAWGGMADKYQNKYRIASARAPWWNYGWNGAYFITICTHHRNHFFGEIVNGAMQLSPVGALAHQYWQEIPNRFPYAQLDARVVMPNHVHGIIMIDKSNPRFHFRRDAVNRVSTEMETETETDKTGGITGTHNPMLHENISRIIRWYKGRTAFESRKTNPDFAWQTRFYDHIIRNNTAWNRIRTYIENNPANWKEDRFFLR